MTEHELAHLHAGSDADAALAKRIEEAMAEARYQRDQELLDALESVPIDLPFDRVLSEQAEELLGLMADAFTRNGDELTFNPGLLVAVQDQLARLFQALHKRQAEAEAALKTFTDQLEN